MGGLYVIIPAYNEEENVNTLIDSWYPIVEAYAEGGLSKLVVIDDGSRDATLSLLKQREVVNDESYVVLSKDNSGHGPTLLYGYRYAIENGAEWIFQTDSDGQTDPAEFKQFWQLRTEYDAIIGSRPDRQDGWPRKFVEKTLLLILRITFGVKIPDSNAPFRLMKRELVEKYIDKMPCDFNLPNVMLTTYFAYFKENIKFVDITFKPRQRGTNSINMKRIVKIGWQALKDFKRLKETIND